MFNLILVLNNVRHVIINYQNISYIVAKYDEGAILGVQLRGTQIVRNYYVSQFLT